MSELINFIYDETTLKTTVEALQEKSFMCLKNDTTDAVNDKNPSLIEGPGNIYLSKDEAILTGKETSESDLLFPIEYLNTISFPGFPAYELHLKVGSPIMLLQNVNLFGGLCNGTRMIVTSLMSKLIEAQINTGTRVGDRSKQPFILEESPVDTMADQRTMAEFLRAPTEGYAEEIMVPPILAEQFDLKHSLNNMMTSDQFFGLEKDNPHDHIYWGSPSLAQPRFFEFLPPSKTSNLRNGISNFQQRIRVKDLPESKDSQVIKIEQYFLLTDYSLWEVILNGDSPAPTRVIDGVLQPVVPTIVEQRPNGEALRKCILSGPYKRTTVLVQVVKAIDNYPAVPEHTTVETPTNMSLENKAHFLAEKEVIHLILTGIGDDIYSTVDACQTAQEMCEAIERLQQVNELRAEKLARNANPLALVATAQASQNPFYQTSRSHRSSAPSPKPLIPTKSHTATTKPSKPNPKPSKPRMRLRWSPTRKMFDIKGKLIAYNESNGDNACTPNPQEPTIKQFPNSTFSLGKLSKYACDLEVAFRRNTFFVRNLEGVDLLIGISTKNLYTINLHDMASASLIFLMARATSTKSWLWHQRLSDLNIETINDLARNNLVTGLPKFKYHKEHLCPSYPKTKQQRRLKPLKKITVLLQAPVIIAEAIATVCYTQNHSVIHRQFNKTPYELINGRKLDISLLHVFGALCYPKNDHKDIGKLDAKGDIGFFV
nr:DNA helicase [Tanacetum cinerariifolium]